MTTHDTSPFGHPQGKQSTAGVWERLPAATAFALKLAVNFGTADAAVLFTVPTGKRMLIERTFWEVVTGFTGGSSSAIGLSSSQTAQSTKGDVLGGASGDVTATLGTAGVKGGTLGADFGTNGVIILEPGATIRFDRVTSVYTAGAGFVHVVGRVVD